MDGGRKLLNGRRGQVEVLDKDPRLVDKVTMGKLLDLVVVQPLTHHLLRRSWVLMIALWHPVYPACRAKNLIKVDFRF